LWEVFLTEKADFSKLNILLLDSWLMLLRSYRRWL